MNHWLRFQVDHPQTKRHSQAFIIVVLSKRYARFPLKICDVAIVPSKCRFPVSSATTLWCSGDGILSLVSAYLETTWWERLRFFVCSKAAVDTATVTNSKIGLDIQVYFLASVKTVKTSSFKHFFCRIKCFFRFFSGKYCNDAHCITQQTYKGCLWVGQTRILFGRFVCARLYMRWVISCHYHISHA